jgi:hypothetical protein
MSCLGRSYALRKKAATLHVASTAPSRAEIAKRGWDGFPTLLTAYQGIKTSPREAAAARKVQTASLSQLIASARSILRNEIDKMVTKFRKTNPDFYNGYFAGRVIVNRAATHPGPKPPTPPQPPAPPPQPQEAATSSELDEMFAFYYELSSNSR